MPLQTRYMARSAVGHRTRPALFHTELQSLKLNPQFATPEAAERRCVHSITTRHYFARPHARRTSSLRGTMTTPIGLTLQMRRRCSVDFGCLDFGVNMC